MSSLPFARRRLLTAALLVAGPAIAALTHWGRGGGTGSAEAPAAETDLCVLAPPLPYEPASGLPLLQARPVPAHARCPVCGMFPARAPEWAAQLIFSDGAVQFFDSPVSLLIFLQDVGRYARGRSAADVAVRYVRDSRKGGWLIAEQAFFVTGSDALGPMRAGNLPAFADAAAAQAFVQTRGGRVLRMAEVPASLLRSLDPRAHLGH